MKPKVNYQLVLEKELEKIRREGRRPRLLLHGCCAPCSSYVLEYLAGLFDITLFYYNPNIAPREEYEHRASEAARLIREMGVDVRLEVAPYEPEEWRAAVRGLEGEPEGTITLRRRCPSRPSRTRSCCAPSGESCPKPSACRTSIRISKRGAAISAPSSSPPSITSTGRITAAACIQKRSGNGEKRPKIGKKDRLLCKMLKISRF